ncbi:MAG: hypothetical protein AB7K86_17455 [Rhodospirillales bacterium]
MPLPSPRPSPRRAGICIAAAVLLAAAALPAAAAGPPELKRVILSTGGVGYFEYQASVENSEELTLSVPLDQVDDVLKSLTVDGARASVALAGREPLEQTFRTLPFDRDALDSPAALLNALQGARIRVAGTRTIEGRLLRVVPVQVRLPDQGGVVTRHRVGVLTAQGLQEFVLEDEPAVEFVEPALRAQVDTALAAVAANQAQGRRTLRVAAAGQGQRTIRLAYVVAAPVWKVSYRLSFRGEAASGARLQGYAILENMSGQDWKGVELTLTSGYPVMYRQELYTALYNDRPVAPVDVPGRLTPRVDQGEMEMAAKAGPARDEARMRGLPQAAAAAPAGRFMALSEAAPSPAPPPPPPPSQTSEIIGGSVLFRLPAPVSARNGESLMVPIVDRSVPAERLSIFQPEVHTLHPLASVRLRNDGDTALPPGLITLYESNGATDTAFVGDARIGVVPAGEERIVGFALDQKTRIDREPGPREQVAKAKIAGGLLELTVTDRNTTVFRIKAPAREAREVVIEQPRMAGWSLADPDEKSVALTPSHYRIARKLPAGGTVTVPVTMSRPVVQQVSLIDTNADRLTAIARMGGLDDAARAAIARAAELKREIDRRQAALGEIDGRRKAIVEEQSRIRDNMARVPANSDLARRYLAKLNEQETELEKLAAERAAAAQRVEEAKKALADYVATVTL